MKKRSLSHPVFHRPSCTGDMCGGCGIDPAITAQRAKKKAKKLQTQSKQANSSTSSPDQSFPFLLLPAELRLEIYNLCLKSSTPLLLNTKVRAQRRIVRLGYYYANEWPRQIHPSANTAPTDFLALLRTCHAIHAEATPVLYANSLHFPSTTELYLFLAQIGPRARARLTNITLRAWGHSGGYGGSTQKLANHAAFSMLIGAERLTRVELDCFIDCKGGMDGKAKSFWRAAEYWIDWIAREKGSNALASTLVLGKMFWRSQKETESGKEKFFQVLCDLNSF